MAGNGPTVINVEADADLVIHKGPMVIALRPDGSVSVNGIIVQAPAQATPAAPAPETRASETPADETPVVETPVAQEPVQQVPVTPAPEPDVEPVSAPPADEPAADEAPTAATETPAPPARDLEAEKAERKAADERRQGMVRDLLKQGKSIAEASSIVSGLLRQEAEAAAAAKQPAVNNPVPVAAPQPQPVVEDVATPTVPVVQALQATTPAPAATPVTPPPVAGPPQIGQTVEGKGVFIGVWRPMDREHRLDGKAYDVYAAPEDLTDEAGHKVMLTFNAAAKRMSELKDWHGHDGADYGNDEGFYKALRKGQYHGEWIIPPKDLLEEPGGRPGILTQSQFQGDMEDTFELVDKQPSSQWYWSSTETKDPDYIYYARFNEPELSDYMGRDRNKIATRPVRIEPKP